MLLALHELIQASDLGLSAHDAFGWPCAALHAVDVVAFLLHTSIILLFFTHAAIPVNPLHTALQAGDNTFLQAESIAPLNNKAGPHKLTSLLLVLHELIQASDFGLSAHEALGWPNAALHAVDVVFAAHIV